MEFIRHTRLNSIWLKAAVIGSLWASVEIVAGSFLHNLQVPFSGTILTAFAILLLSAFSRLWKESGIIWRAGIICALMKSISPSAVIIGPMVGIITESFLFELLLIVLGRNFIGTIAGGAIAAVSAIIHKFFTLLILYGFDFVRILDSLYHYAVKQLNIPNIQAVDVIGMLAALYAFIGIAAASIGFFIGNNFIKRDEKSENQLTIKLRSDNQLFDLSGKQNFSALLILVNLMVMTAVLWLLNLQLFMAAWSIALLFAGFCIYRYPNALRRFKKISVWVQFLVIVVTSVLVWDVFKANDPNGESGWTIGLTMIFRAILLIIGFAAISVELKNPLVKAVLYKRGLSNLYQSVTMAFGVLPDLAASLSKSKLSILNPVNLLAHLLRTSQNLIQFFEEEQSNLPAIFMITGEIGEGKTSFVDTLTRKLLKRDCRSGGFLSVGLEDGSERTGFRLVDIRTQESTILCCKTFQQGWSRTGRYFFNPEAIEFGTNILDPKNLKGVNLVVVDEIGPLEMNNRGWSTAIERLNSKLSTPQLWIVRKSLVKQIVRKWNVGDIYIFDVAQDSSELIEDTILSNL